MSSIPPAQPSGPATKDPTKACAGTHDGEYTTTGTRPFSEGAPQEIVDVWKKDTTPLATAIADKLVKTADGAIQKAVLGPIGKDLGRAASIFDKKITDLGSSLTDDLPESLSGFEEFLSGLDHDGTFVAGAPITKVQGEIYVKAGTELLRTVAYPTTELTGWAASARGLLPEKCRLRSVLKWFHDVEDADPKKFLADATESALLGVLNMVYKSQRYSEDAAVAKVTCEQTRKAAVWFLGRIEEGAKLAAQTERQEGEAYEASLRAYAKELKTYSLEFFSWIKGDSSQALPRMFSDPRGGSASQDVLLKTKITVPDLVGPHIMRPEEPRSKEAAASSQSTPERATPQLGSLKVILDDGGKDKQSSSVSQQHSVSEKRKEFCAATRAFLEESVRKKARSNPVLLEKPPEIPYARTWSLTVSPVYLSEARSYAQKINSYQLKGMSQDEFDENLKWHRRRLENLEKDVHSVPADIVLGEQKGRVEAAATALQAAQKEHGRTGRNALNVDRETVRLIAELEFYDRLVVKQASSPVEDRPVTGFTVEEWLSARISHDYAQRRAGKHAHPHCITHKAEKFLKEASSGIGIGRDPAVIAEDAQFMADVFGSLAERDEKLIDRTLSYKSHSSNPEEGSGWTHEQLKEKIDFNRARIQEQQGRFEGMGLDSQIEQQKKVVEAVAAAYEAADAEALGSHEIKKRNEIFCQYVAEVDLLADLEVRKSELSSESIPTVPVAEETTSRPPEKEKSAAPQPQVPQEPPKVGPKETPSATAAASKVPKSVPQEKPPGLSEKESDKEQPKGQAASDNPMAQATQFLHNIGVEGVSETVFSAQFSARLHRIQQREGSSHASDHDAQIKEQAERTQQAKKEVEDAVKKHAVSSDGKKVREALFNFLAEQEYLNQLKGNPSEKKQPSIVPEKKEGDLNHLQPALAPQLPNPAPQHAEGEERKNRDPLYTGHFGSLASSGIAPGIGRDSLKFSFPTKLSNPGGVAANIQNFSSMAMGEGPLYPGYFTRGPRNGHAEFHYDPSVIAYAPAAKLALDHADALIEVVARAANFILEAMKTAAIASYVLTKKATRGVYEATTGKDYYHAKKVELHAKAVEEVKNMIPMLEPYDKGLLSLLDPACFEGEKKYLIEEIVRSLQYRESAFKELREIYAREKALHDRNEQDTKLYRVSFEESITSADQRFFPVFVLEIRSAASTMTTHENEILSLLQEFSQDIHLRRFKGPIQTLVAHVVKHPTITSKAMYKKGIEELAVEITSLKQSSEGFKVLSRVYIEEFVDAICLKDLFKEFGASEEGRKFMGELNHAYRNFLDAEKEVIETQEYHDSRIFLSRWVHTVFVDKPQAARKKMEQEKEKLLAVMKRVHVHNLFSPKQEIPPPLVAPFLELRQLVEGQENPVSPEWMRRVACSLLLSLGRPPLYQEEKKWLDVALPQKLLFGDCVDSESLAAEALYLEWHRKEYSPEGTFQDAYRRFEDVVVPLIGPIQTPEEILATTDEGKKRAETLRVLNAWFSASHIKGDGHCLFRSIGAGILKNHFKELRHVVERATSGAHPLLVSEASRECAGKVLEAIQRVEGGESFLSVLRDRACSQGLVQFLRLVSGEWWRSRPESEKATLINALEADRAPQPASSAEGSPATEEKRRRSILEKYLSDIERMDGSILYGGEPELVALSCLLELPIVLFDAAGSAESKKIQGRWFQQQHSQDAVLAPEVQEFSLPLADTPLNRVPRNAVFLLKEPGHYNILFPLEDR